MKATTQALLSKIEAAHDWADGQTRGGSGTLLTRTDTCRVCSLRRHYLSDAQNGIDREYRFSDGETGADLSLRQAVDHTCI